MSPCASGAVLAAGRRGLGPALVAGFLDDRRDLGIVEEALEARLVPVEEHPDPIILVGIAEDGRPLGAVLLPLLGTLRREDLRELVEVLDRRRSQKHQSPFQEVGRAAARRIRADVRGTADPTWPDEGQQGRLAGGVAQSAAARSSARSSRSVAPSDWTCT